MVYAQTHDFGLISFQTYQEFKGFSSRESVKNCNFFEFFHFVFFMNITDIIILRLEMESLCPGGHFYTIKLFGFEKTSKYFSSFYDIFLQGFEKPQKRPNFFSQKFLELQNILRTLRIFFWTTFSMKNNYIFYCLVIGSKLAKIEDNRTPQNPHFWGVSHPRRRYFR